MSDYSQDSLSAAPPCFDVARLYAVLQEHYGLDGDLTALVGESEQNIQLVTARGARFVLKVAAAAEFSLPTDLQAQALLHLENGTCPLRTPRIVITKSGNPLASIDSPAGCHRVRLVTWVDGSLLRDADHTQDVMSLFGEGLATLGHCLQDFEYAEDERSSYWDMCRALQLRRILVHIDDNRLRDSVGAAFDDFEHRILPRLADLRTQFIHNDANPDNVLIDAGTRDVAFIDFGDMLRAPLVFDIAIGASYLRELDDDPCKLITPFVAGYHRIVRLQDIEMESLFDLVRTRLATTISMLYWRLAARPDGDDYRQQTLLLESSAAQFLKKLDDLGRKAFLQALQDVI